MALSAGLASIDGNTRLVGFHDDQKGDKGSIWHGENENNAPRPTHGLLRGAGAEKLAHQQRKVVAGDVEQVVPPVNSVRRRNPRVFARGQLRSLHARDHEIRP